MIESASTRLRMDEDVEPDQIGFAVADQLEIHGAVSMRDALKLVVKIVNDFRERQLVGEHHPLRRQVFLPQEGTAALRAHLHQVADISHGHDEADLHERLAELLNLSGIGHVLRAIHLNDRRVPLEDFVSDVRGGLHQVEIAIALEPLLNDLAVQHPQEAAAEAESEPFAIFRYEGEAGIVQLEPGQRFAKHLEIVVIDRVQAAEDHRLRLLVPGEGFGGRPVRVGDGVADMDVAEVP